MATIAARNKIVDAPEIVGMLHLFWSEKFLKSKFYFYLLQFYGKRSGSCKTETDCCGKANHCHKLFPVS
jgi:hypothetical protein